MTIGTASIIALRVLAFFAGLSLVVRTLLSEIRTFVLPRSAPDGLTRIVFQNVRKLFEFNMRNATTYEERDRVMALYAPISTLFLIPFWLVLIMLGYTGIFLGIGVPTLHEAFRLSGSSLFTLGIAPVSENAIQTALVFSEAVIGLMVVALLIAYLPTMYSAFSQRKAAVNMLEVRAGSPPSAATMISRLHRIGRIGHLTELWEQWETWFAYVEETHTSLAALAFFRSPQPDRSWVTAAGAMLDAAAMVNAVVDIPHDSRADLCIRAGYLCLRQIAYFFRVELLPIPEVGDPDIPNRISISRHEFDEAVRQLEESGVPLKADRERAWQDFAGWRVTYDTPLLALARITMAPYAPWSSDRSLPRQPRARGMR